MSRPARQFELADALMHARAVREQAETALARARQHEREARRRRQEVADELAAIDQRLAAGGMIDARALVALAGYREHVQRQLQEATRAAALAGHEVQQRLRALDEARQRVEALEALEAKQRQARNRWQMQREQNAADEQAATRAAAKRRDQAG